MWVGDGQTSEGELSESGSPGPAKRGLMSSYNTNASIDRSGARLARISRKNRTCSGTSCSFRNVDFILVLS